MGSQGLFESEFLALGWGLHKEEEGAFCVLEGDLLWCSVRLVLPVFLSAGPGCN